MRLAGLWCDGCLLGRWAARAKGMSDTSVQQQQRLGFPLWVTAPKYSCGIIYLSNPPLPPDILGDIAVFIEVSEMHPQDAQEETGPWSSRIVSLVVHHPAMYEPMGHKTRTTHWDWLNYAIFFPQTFRQGPLGDKEDKQTFQKSKIYSFFPPRYWRKRQLTAYFPKLGLGQ